MNLFVRRFVTLGLCASFVLVASCKKKDTAQQRDTLTINFETEPPTLDWNKSTDTTSSHVLDNLMDGLTYYDFNDPNLKAIPSLAESWDISKDGTVYTFHLSKTAKWHDGVPLTAQHFVDGWKRLIDPQTASMYAYFLYDIKNAKEFNEKKVDFSQVGLRALDNSTLQVTLKHPAAYFLYIPTHTSTYPVRMDLIQKYGDRWTEAGNFVGIGPYKLITWIHDSKLVMERNEDYYGPKAKIKTIIGRMVTEQSSALTLVETGQIDMLTTVPSLELDRLRKGPTASELKEEPLLAAYYIGFNIRKKPFNDPRVRKAFSMAVDRTEITKVLNGGQIPFSSWIPKGILGYDPQMGIKFNPEKAKQLLKEAGYETPSKLPKIIMMFNTNEDHKRIMENVQAQLGRNLGVKVEIENQEWKVYIDKLNTLKRIANHDATEEAMSMFRMGWVADYPDPDNFMNLFTSYSDNNHTGWANKEYDQLIQKAVATMDLNERKALYAKAQTILTETDVPIMPLYVYVQHMMIKNYVKGYKVNPLQKMKLDTAYFE